MKMVAVNSGDTAMAVAHVFAKANVSNRDQVRLFRFDRQQQLLVSSVVIFGDTTFPDGFLRPHRRLRLLAHLYTLQFRKAGSLAALDPERGALHRESPLPATGELRAYSRQAGAGPIFRLRTAAKQNHEWSNVSHGRGSEGQGSAAGDADDEPIFA